MGRIQKRATRLRGLGIKVGGMRAGYFQKKKKRNEEGRSYIFPSVKLKY